MFEVCVSYEPWMSIYSEMYALRSSQHTLQLSMDDGQVSQGVIGRVGGAHASLIGYMIVHKFKRHASPNFLHLGVPRGPHGRLGTL